MKKITLLIFGFVCLSTFSVSAQTYKTAVGAKFYTGNGSQGGINVRHILSERNAVEGTLLFYTGGLGIEGLYEIQGGVNGAEGLQYFAGGGALLGAASGRNNSLTFALRLTAGLDYKIPDAPINLSLGLDPFFYLAPSTGSNLSLGIGLRYTLP